MIDGEIEVCDEMVVAVRGLSVTHLQPKLAEVSGGHVLIVHHAPTRKSKRIK